MLIIAPCSKCGTPHNIAPRSTSLRCFHCNTVTAIPQLQPASLSTRLQQQQLQEVPPRSFASGHPQGPKRAVLCGINYCNSPSELQGCVTDALLMKTLLQDRFGFPYTAILLLVDEGTAPRMIPTKENIRLAMRWLVAECQPGDSLVFHFSGHGGQQRDIDGDEVDGFDETLCPLDFEEEGPIVDDEINEIIVKPLPRGAKLHALVDACHSGTSLDLPYLCRMNRSGQYEWEDHRPRNGSWKGTNGGEAISISGCDDHQFSADTSALSGTNTGVLTYSFIEAVKQGGQTPSYGFLINSMRRLIRTAHTRGSSSYTLDTGSGFILMQEPQLTSDEQFDVYKKVFSL